MVPSGDQLGHLSCAPEECVRLRVGPFSIGAVKMSPRAAKERSLALRTQIHRFDMIRSRDAAGTAGKTFIGNGDGNWSAFFGSGIEHL